MFLARALRNITNLGILIRSFQTGLPRQKSPPQMTSDDLPRGYRQKSAPWSSRVYQNIMIMKDLRYLGSSGKS